MNGFQNGIIPTEVQECSNCDNLTPRNFPLALSMDNNSTVLTFAGLSNIDRSSIAIQTQPTPYAVQVRRAGVVKFQALVNGERVKNSILVRMLSETTFTISKQCPMDTLHGSLYLQTSI